MAQYEIGGQVYEVPDNLPPQQLQQILEQLAGGQPQADTDGALAYSVDRAQQMLGKGIEVVGDLVGSEGMTSYGADVVAQQERDIAAGGYQPKYTKTLGETFKEDGISAALGWIGEKTLENAASGGAAIVGTGAALLTAPFSAPAALVIGGGTLVGSGLMGAGETALEMEEKTGEYDSAVAAGVGVIVGILDKFGAGKVIPTEKLATMTGQEIVEELLNKGFVEAAADVGNRIARSAIGEGTTELGQEAAIVSGSALTGGQYTAQELADRGLESFVLGGTMGGGARTAIETAGGVSRIFGGGGTAPADPEAAAELAQRLLKIANEGGPNGRPEFNLNDVDRMSQTGARAVVEAAHVDIAEDIKQAVSDLKSRLQVKDSDNLAAVLQKVNAQAAIRMARNKTKSVITNANFQAVKDLAGDTAEGQRLLSLIRQSNELTAIHNAGYQGGVSRITDQFSPIGSQSSYDRGFSTLETIVRPVTALGAGVINPAIPAAQAAVTATGRGIDALTGRRSRVRRYIEQNAGRQGIQQRQAPSLRQQAQEADEANAQRLADEAVQRRNLNLKLAQRNAPPQPDSPQGRLEAATGLDRNGAARIIRMIEATSLGQDPMMQRAIASYRENVAYGGYVEELTPLIRAIKSMQDSDPRIDELRVRPRDDQAAQDQANIDAAREQGKRDNQAFNQQLQDDLSADKSIDNQSKAVAGEALRELRLDLGRTPVSEAERIEADALKKASNPSVVSTYVTPYVDRVRRQQGADETADAPIEQFVDLRMPDEQAPKRTHREIGELLMEEQAQRYGRDLDPYNDGGDFEAVAQAMTEEAQFQFDKTPDAATWYDEDIAEALQKTAEVIPEIAESPTNKQLFLMLAAITSVGHKPRPNWRYAGALALHYFRTGDIGEAGQVYSEKRQQTEDRTVNPTTGKLFGPKAPSIEPGINIIDHMVKKMGVEATLDWINSDKTKKEIDAMRKEAGYGPQGKIKGGMNVVVPGIQMFGPKVGPFYLNLNGIKEVTVDLWASRTVRRHTGGLLNPNYDPNAKKKEGTGLIDAPTEVERPTMKNLFTRVGENLGVTPQAAQAILWAYEQELYNDLGAKVETQRFSEGAQEFVERDAVAYAERYPRSAARQNRSGARDTSSPAIEESRQYSFDFGNTQPGQPGTNPGRDGIPQVVGSRPATTEQIRDVQPVTNAMFEVGKPGGEFENGIPDLRTAEKLAKALGASLYVVNNKNDLARVFGRTRMGAQNEFVKGGAQMRPDPTQSTRDRNLGQDVRGVIGVLGEYNNPRNPEETVTAKEAIWHALHEIGHVIEGSFVPGETQTKANTRYKRFSDQKDQRSDRLFENTFRQGVASLLDAAAGLEIDGYSQQDATDILNEIVQLQRKGVLDDGTTPVRDTYPYFDQVIDRLEAEGNLQRARAAELQLMRAEDSYFQTPQELAADLIGFYLMSPQQAKQQMPKATKLVRDILNSSNVVTFYSMPLAALVAAIFANMLVAEQEEEEKRGALALGQGALTA